MKRITSLLLLALVLPAAGFPVGPNSPHTVSAQQPRQTQDAEDEVIRISSDLVQTSVVVTDKNDRIVSDLKMADFEVYENGKRQDVKFMEFVSVAGERRTEGTRAGLPESARMERELAARDVRRVVAFVVDDLTINYSDMMTVRRVLREFVDDKMQQGDLVAIIRTVGGKGLLEQFTSDRDVLRRAVAELRTITAVPNASGGENQAAATLQQMIDSMGAPSAENIRDIGIESATTAIEESTRLNRSLMALATTQSVIENLRDLPGRKSLVLLSGGLPGFGAGAGNTASIGGGARMQMPSLSAGLGSSLNAVLRVIADEAVRSGVVINTMDPRGLGASPGVRGFQHTPAGSALIGGDPNFGKGGSELSVFGGTLEGGEERLSLRILSDTTGGVPITNTNDLSAGLDKILARSQGYYVLAYSPTEKFDNKFRKLDVKVRRDGLRLYKYAGYLARADRESEAPRTKEQEIVRAARAPLARRDVDVTANLSMRMTPPKGAALGINLLIDPKTLGVAETGGEYRFSFDVVGFVLDERGKTRGGFSQTVSGALKPEEYRRAEETGLAYSAGTQLPPGFYQLRVVVREAGGRLGTVSRYVEVPDLSKGRTALSSIFLHAVDFGGTSQPVPLTAVRQLLRKQDLRYTAIVYNPKLEGGKPRLLTQTVISRGGQVVYRGPVRPATPRGNDPSQVALVEQIGLSKLTPGRYVLTLAVTDALAGSKEPPFTRSIDFTVTE